jgi:hypothetical protein
MPTKQSRSKPAPKRRLAPITEHKQDKQAKREAAIAQEQFKQGRAYELHLATTALTAADGIGTGTEAAAFLERGEHRR